MKTRNKIENYTSQAIEDIFKEISPAELKRTEKKMLLAAKIDDAIKSKGWKKADFARAMGKRPSEISKWLSGTHNFTADTMSDIEDILGIKLIVTEEKAESSYKFRPVELYFQIKPGNRESSNYESFDRFTISSEMSVKEKIHLSQTT